jgi:hypothetical protein
VLRKPERNVAGRHIYFLPTDCLLQSAGELWIRRLYMTGNCSFPSYATWRSSLIDRTAELALRANVPRLAFRPACHTEQRCLGIGRDQALAPREQLNGRTVGVSLRRYRPEAPINRLNGQSFKSVDQNSWCFIPNKAATEALLRSAGFTMLQNLEPEVYPLGCGEPHYAAERPPIICNPAAD